MKDTVNQAAVLKAVGRAFSLFSKGRLSFGPTEKELREDPEIALTYVQILVKNGIEPESVMDAAVLILETEKTWPTPAVVLDAAKPAQAERNYRRNRKFLDTCVNCVDDSGNFCLAPASRVRNGLLLPEGDNSGDGSQAKALPGTPSKRAQKMLKALQARDNANVRGSGLVRSTDVK